jgi:serine/threonine-protein kinase
MTSEPRLVRVVGRYAIYDEVAAGGMAAVHLGRLQGAAGFSRTVAVKRLHAHYAKNPAFVAMLTDEARLAARIQHPNVVPTLDVVAKDEELFVVMDYIQGETLSRLLSDERVPPKIACAILVGALQGLHAAHEAVGAEGEPLALVHRDVTPHNIIVGVDGVARVLDFGVAKAAGRLASTDDGAIKGKMGYMPPEQLYGNPLDRRTDVFAAGVVLWELLTGRRLFVNENNEASIAMALNAAVDPPGVLAPETPPALDPVVLKALERDMDDRYASALDFAQAIEKAAPLASAAEVGRWVKERVGSLLEERRAKVSAIEALEKAGPALPRMRDGITNHEADPLDDEPASGVTHPGLARSTSHTRADAPVAKRRQLRWYVVAGATAVAAMLVFAFSQRQTPAAPAAAVPQDTSEPRPAAEPEAKPEPKPAPAPTPAPTPAEENVKKPTTAKKAPAVVAKNCNPPFTLDAQGHKRYKRECFK